VVTVLGLCVINRCRSSSYCVWIGFCWRECAWVGGDEPAVASQSPRDWRLVRRAGRHPLLTLAVAPWRAALLFALQLHRPPAFAARAELLLRENACRRIEPGSRARICAAWLRMSPSLRPRLMDVMDRHGLFPADLARSPVLAVAEMRKSIGGRPSCRTTSPRIAWSARPCARPYRHQFSAEEPDQALAVVARSWPVGGPGRARRRPRGKFAKRSLPVRHPPGRATRAVEPKPSWRPSKAAGATGVGGRSRPLSS